MMARHLINLMWLEEMKSDSNSDYLANVIWIGR